METVTSFRRQSGFTLIELVIAMLIIAALLASLLMPLAAQKNAQAFEATKKSMQQIKHALLGYAQIHGHFPCPDTNIPPNGFANTCSGTGPYRGYIPWKDLAVDSSDAWGQNFYYVVDKKFTAPLINFVTDACSSNFCIKLRKNNQDITFNTTTNQSTAVALILSSGKDRRLDTENNNNNNIYRTEDFVEGTFDDVVVWISKYVIAHHLATVGKWPD
jgi:prepilin-type N-terminal cleavage/methylation domain-containing protein